MSRERDRNTKKFSRQHYEIIAARFREEFSVYVDSDGQPAKDDEQIAVIAAIQALAKLVAALDARFEFDNEDYDREIFLKRCSPYDDFDLKEWM
ncbi:MAG TPA: hypothetical protein VGE97_07335 [Nitrososphaera sp.]|jgi:hypothetical protein